MQNWRRHRWLRRLTQPLDSEVFLPLLVLCALFGVLAGIWLLRALGV